jgi:GTP pyrophosphokinase
VTSRSQTPSPTWERFVVTGKARACIRRYIRTQQRAQYLELGRSILAKDFRHDGHEVTEKALSGALKKLKCESVEELYAAVGAGNLTGREVIAAVFPGLKPVAEEKIPGTKRGRANKKPGVKESNAIPITGLIPGMAINFAGCCHPLPGDRIVGIVTTGKGVTIHTIDCETLESFADSPERWLDVAWHVDPAKADGHVGRLHVVVANEPGSLGSLSTVIGKSEGNITNLKITNRSADFFEMMIDVEVKDVRHLTNIIAALRATPAINTVERARG